MTERFLHESGPAVALLPYGKRVTHRMSRLSLDELIWPVGRPERLGSGCVSDMSSDDHLLAYATSRLLYMPRPGIKAKISILVVEPQAVQGRKIAWLKLLWRRFYRVLSADPSLLATAPNGERYLFGSTWVPDWRDVDVSKSRMLSLIASSKTDLEGHRLRHEVIDWIRAKAIDADVLGRGYAPFERKSDGLAPYRYSVIIENVREPDYFTEKLIDCLLCETVPIYWGAQRITETFDPGGMLICQSLDEIKAAIATISPEDYQSRLEFIAKNKEKAARYANHELAAARIVEKAAQRDKRQP
ncbi:glycosyltransferase family 10 [Hoeflea sp. AS60]|uniref:glycosyltransferase family 10 domain-containing protein n=1 Tax=Hoeflea sp. AS60 TaxID=3135780 RepID=UPI0031712A74